jgi:hypothetical protein
MTSKTRDEIETLKTQWAADPTWDIEDTEGFEAHRFELRRFRIETDAALAIEAGARIEAKRNRRRRCQFWGELLGGAVAAVGAARGTSALEVADAVLDEIDSESDVVSDGDSARDLLEAIAAFEAGKPYSKRVGTPSSFASQVFAARAASLMLASGLFEERDGALHMLTDEASP